jgi:hypothetical protein
MLKMPTDLGGDHENHFSIYTRSGVLKTLLHLAPCYILVGISRESILISSPPRSLLEIQWNNSIEESRSRVEDIGNRALSNGHLTSYKGETTTAND